MNGGKGDEREDNKRDESERINNDDLYIYIYIYIYKERKSKIDTTTIGISSPFMNERTHKKTTTITTTKIVERERERDGNDEKSI